MQAHMQIQLRKLAPVHHIPNLMVGHWHGLEIVAAVISQVSCLMSSLTLRNIHDVAGLPILRADPDRCDSDALDSGIDLANNLVQPFSRELSSIDRINLFRKVFFVLLLKLLDAIYDLTAG